MFAVGTRKYDQHLRADAAEQTRRRILDAVYERLCEVPAEPVSVDRVARIAQVARSTVYLVFGSRAGLFDAVGADLLDRGGFDRLLRAAEHPNAREGLRGGIRAGVALDAANRDVLRVLHSMALLDAEAVGGAIQRMERGRAAGMAYLAGRLAEQECLRPGIGRDAAADVLWLLTSFDSFDLLYTGRSLSVDEVAARLIAVAESSLCREAPGQGPPLAPRPPL